MTEKEKRLAERVSILRDYFRRLSVQSTTGKLATGTARPFFRCSLEETAGTVKTRRLD